MGSNWVGERACYDVLGSLTGITAAMMTADTMYYGADRNGAIVPHQTEGSAGFMFDGRLYRQVQFIWLGTFANNVSLECNIIHYQDPAQATYGWNTYKVGPGNGGTVVVECGSGAAESSNANEYAGVSHTFSPVRAGLFRLKTYRSGATGVITGGAGYVIGIR